MFDTGFKEGGGEGTGGGRKETCELIIKSESSNEENKLQGQTVLG